MLVAYCLEKGKQEAELNPFLKDPASIMDRRVSSMTIKILLTFYFFFQNEDIFV